jgi:hypothetical protein
VGGKQDEVVAAATMAMAIPGGWVWFERVAGGGKWTYVAAMRFPAPIELSGPSMDGDALVVLN